MKEYLNTIVSLSTLVTHQALDLEVALATAKKERDEAIRLSALLESAEKELMEVRRQLSTHPINWHRDGLEADLKGAREECNSLSSFIISVFRHPELLSHAIDKVQDIPKQEKIQRVRELRELTGFRLKLAKECVETITEVPVS
jgi:hypothetical protein